MNSRAKRARKRADAAMLATLDRRAREQLEGWSDLEVEFYNRWRQLAPQAPLPEHDAPNIVQNRKFRGDFVWREMKVVVELEGATFVQGRHTRGVGYESDCEKYNLLTATGWRVLRFTRAMLRRDPVGCIALVQSLVDPLPFGEPPLPDNGGFQD